VLGIRPSNTELRIDGNRLDVDFGPWRVRTEVANVVSTEVTGPYTALRAIGPHLSLKDRGASFGTNIRAGTCLLFARPVRALDPFGVLRHPGLTVTVEDTEGLAARLAP
jgi:hypothetical protein